MSDEKVITLSESLEFDDTVHAEVKAFGGIVHLTSLSTELYTEYLSERESPVHTGHRNLLLLVYSMFTPEQRSLPKEERLRLAAQGSLQLFKKKGIQTLSMLTNKALEIHGLKDEQKEERKNVSSEAPSDASLTA